MRRIRFHASRALAAATLLGLGAGCASLPGPLAAREGRTAAVARPDAPVEYDVLVAEFAAREQDLRGARDALLRAAAKDPDSAWLHQRIAIFSVQIGEPDVAIEHAERAVAIDPDDVSNRMLLARLYAQQRNLAGVEKALLDARGRPISLYAGRFLVRVYMELGQAARAVDAARRLREAYPDEIGAHLALAAALARAGDRAGLQAALEEAILAFPDEKVLYIQLGAARREAGDREGEIDAYQRLLERQPDDYEALTALGNALILEKDFDAAFGVYERLARAYPDEPAVQQRLAWLEWQRGEPRAAERRLLAALERYPDAPGIAYMLGLVRTALGDDDGAMRALREVRPGDPGYVDAQLRIVDILEAQERWAEALAILEPLRQQSPDRELDFHIATVRARTGDLEGAVSLLQQYLDEDPDDAEALYQMGIVHDIAGRKGEALRWMQRVIERDPKNAHALNYVGYSWAERGERLDEAERLIQRALEQAPEDGYITDSLGWLYYMRARPLVLAGRRDEARPWLERARETLERALDLSGGDPVIAEHLGDLHRLMGDKQAALDAYEQALQLGPRSDEQPRLPEKVETLRRELAAQ